MNVLAVGIAGAIGALLRYSVDIALPTEGNDTFPLATLLINWVGCAVLGWFAAWAAGRAERIPEWFRLGFGTGMIGSFTTFSTFSMETIELIRHGQMGTAAGYVLLSMWVGLLFAWLGYLAGKRQCGKTTGGAHSS